MKVVLFCGGLGTRLREHSVEIPKPLVTIGHRPIIWHLMRYYAHYGHRDFILCLGYRGDMIREYFVNYQEWLTNDFVLSQGGKKIELKSADLDDWRITFVETGLHSNVGQRLLRVRKYLQDEEIFLVNYADALTDLALNQQIAEFIERRAIVSMLTVPPAESFHSARVDDTGLVTELGPIRDAGFWVNAGYFCMRSEIFDHIQEGEDLVEQPFQRLIERRKLIAHPHRGFWRSMDTFKDKITYDRMESRGDCPWMIWNH